MAAMDGDWGRLADEIKAELNRRDWSQRDLAEAAGVGKRTISRMMDGKPHPRVPDKATKVEDALGWQTGTVRTILLGGEVQTETEEVPMNELIDELLAHLDQMVARTTGRKRRGYEERARVIRARLSRFRGDDHG